MVHNVDFGVSTLLDRSTAALLIIRKWSEYCLVDIVSKNTVKINEFHRIMDK